MISPFRPGFTCYSEAQVAADLASYRCSFHPPPPPPGKVCGETAHPLVADEAECLAECRAQARIQGAGTTIAPQTYPGGWAGTRRREACIGEVPGLEGLHTALNVMSAAG